MYEVVKHSNWRPLIVLLFLHWVAKGQIMQRSGPVWHFWRAESVGWTATSLQGSRVPIPVVWRVVRVEGTHRLISAGFWMKGIRLFEMSQVCAKIQ